MRNDRCIWYSFGDAIIVNGLARVRFLALGFVATTWGVGNRLDSIIVVLHHLFSACGSIEK